MILLYLQFCGSGIQAAWLVLLLFGVVLMEVLTLQMALHVWYLGEDGWEAGLTAPPIRTPFHGRSHRELKTPYMSFWDPGNSRSHKAFYDPASKVT